MNCIRRDINWKKKSRVRGQPSDTFTERWNIVVKKLSRYLEKCIYIVSFIVIFWIMFLLLFFSNTLKYACKKEFVFSNLVIFNVFLIILLMYFIIKNKFRIKICNLNLDKIVKICSIVFFFIQLYISYNIFFETGWDSGGAIVPAARTLLNNGNVAPLNDSYFSLYPNNLFLVNIYYLILKINKSVGIFYGENQLMAIVVFNCAISSITCWLIYLIGKQIKGNKYAFIGYVLSLALIGISPWMVVCYSDSFVLFVPITILYVYTNKKIPCVLKYTIIYVMGYLGYCIKPQAIIVVVGIVIVDFITFLRKNDRKTLLKGFLGVVISVVLIILLSKGLNILYQREGFETNSDKTFGLSHFFMMGLNPERLGVWSGEDVDISLGCKNQDERVKKNIEVSKERLKKFGGYGYLKFLSKKMLTNYNDGTFAWGEEGGFYFIQVDDRNEQISMRLKATYYNDGAHFWLYSLGAQFVWIITLTLVTVATITSLFIHKRRDSQYLIIILSILGITLFELLFEARARYLYLYIPMFVLAAIYGISDIDIYVFGRKKDEKANIIYSDTLL